MGKIFEFFGYDPRDQSADAKKARRKNECPFLQSKCTKKLHGGEPGGVCTLAPRDAPVIICPIRLYANDYQVLRDVSDRAFRPGLELVVSAEAELFRKENPDVPCVVVFGQRWGKELRLPSRDVKGGGAYFVDWVLAQIDPNGKLVSFVAVEVQSIDTTGNYRDERLAYLQNEDFEGKTTANLNWENVNKRIMPQLIYKGHVLRREPLCHKGLFFICPKPVYEKFATRLGGNLDEIHPQSGSVTIMWYDVGPAVSAGEIRSLVLQGQSTVTTDTIALAFTAPKNLPPHRVYEEAIRREL